MTKVHERCDDAGARQGWRPAVRVDMGGRLQKAVRTSSGGVRVKGAVTRAGVLTYRCADGTIVRELVPPEELERADAVETLRDVPITVGHPEPDADGSQLVKPETYRQLSVGHVTQGHGVDETRHLLAELVVMDAETIGRVDSGELAELSPGYTCKIDPTPGIYEGQAYDQVQRERVYNHLALLPEGGARGGASVALRFDSADGRDVAVQVESDGGRRPPTERTDSMDKQRIDGVTYTVGSTEWAEALSRRAARLDEEKAELEKAKADMEADKEKADMDLEAMKAERDTLKEKVAELEGKIAELEDPEAMDARADARAALLTAARSVLGQDAKLARADGKPMSALEVKKAVLGKLCPNLDLEDKSQAYIEARYDGAIEASKDRPSDALNQSRADAFKAPPSSAGVPSPHTADREPPPDITTRYRRD